MYSYCDMQAKFSFTSFFRFLESEEKRQANQDCHGQGKKKPKKAKKTNQKKQASEKESTDQDKTKKKKR